MARKPATKKTAAKKKNAATRTDGLNVPLHSVIHFAKMLHAEGHTDKFVAAAKDSKAFMTLHPAGVKFVKDYLSSNKLHPAMITHVVNPCPGDPFECHFRD
jgi:hypothetical protein